MSKAPDPSTHDIVVECVHKIVQVIVRSRIPADPNQPLKESTKRNQWFNLEQHDLPVIRERLSTEMKTHGEDVHVDVFVRANKGDASRILLERWNIQYEKGIELRSGRIAHVEPSNMYKRLIIMVRSLYSFLRVLPGHSLVKRANSLFSDGTKPEFCLEAEISGSADSASFDQQPENFCFTSITTPEGKLHFSVFYRSDCDFSWAISKPIIMNLPIFDDYMGRSPQSADSSAVPSDDATSRQSALRFDTPNVPSSLGSFRSPLSRSSPPLPHAGQQIPSGQFPLHNQQSFSGQHAVASDVQLSPGKSPRGPSSNRSLPRLCNNAPIQQTDRSVSSARGSTLESNAAACSDDHSLSHSSHHIGAGPDFSRGVGSGDNESELGSFISALQSMPDLHLLSGLERLKQQTLFEALDSLQELNDELLEQANQQAQQGGVPIPHLGSSSGSSSYTGSRRNSVYHGTASSPGAEGHLGNVGGTHRPPLRHGSLESLGHSPQDHPSHLSAAGQQRTWRRSSFDQREARPHSAAATPPMYIPQPSPHYSSQSPGSGWFGGQEGGHVFPGSAPTMGAFGHHVDSDTTSRGGYDKGGNPQSLHNGKNVGRSGVPHQHSQGPSYSPRQNYAFQQHPQLQLGYEGSFDPYRDAGEVAGSLPAPEPTWQRRGSLSQRPQQPFPESTWDTAGDGSSGDARFGGRSLPSNYYHGRRESPPQAANHSQHLPEAATAHRAAGTHSYASMRDQRKSVNSSLFDTGCVAPHGRPASQEDRSTLGRMRTYTEPVGDGQRSFGHSPSAIGAVSRGGYWGGQQGGEMDLDGMRPRSDSPSGVYDPRVRSIPIAISHHSDLIGGEGGGGPVSQSQGGHSNGAGGIAHPGSYGQRNGTPPFAGSYGSHHSSPSASALYSQHNSDGVAVAANLSSSSSRSGGGGFLGSDSPETGSGEPYRHGSYRYDTSHGPPSWSAAAGSL
eukprot:gb/GEZN01001249.1/.p1 GENE.gb/GEZN01001249.1/~~gb/GEZN01001249.1/.p1  ORF type:complete len:956 (+),score=34.54 gb/GEZN01001249.1/:189-3056(+)